MSRENEESNEINFENSVKKKPINFRTEILKGVHSPSDVLSPFSQKISAERNSALKNFKPKSLMDRLLSVKTSSQLVEPEEPEDIEGSEDESVTRVTNSVNVPVNVSETPTTPEESEDEEI